MPATLDTGAPALLYGWRAHLAPHRQGDTRGCLSRLGQTFPRRLAARPPRRACGVARPGARARRLFWAHARTNFDALGKLAVVVFLSFYAVAHVPSGYIQVGERAVAQDHAVGNVLQVPHHHFLLSTLHCRVLVGASASAGSIAALVDAFESPTVPHKALSAAARTHEARGVLGQQAHVGHVQREPRGPPRRLVTLGERGVVRAPCADLRVPPPPQGLWRLRTPRQEGQMHLPAAHVHDHRAPPGELALRFGRAACVGGVRGWQDGHERVHPDHHGRFAPVVLHQCHCLPQSHLGVAVQGEVCPDLVHGVLLGDDGFPQLGPPARFELIGTRGVREQSSECRDGHHAGLLRAWVARDGVVDAPVAEHERLQFGDRQEGDSMWPLDHTHHGTADVRHSRRRDCHARALATRSPCSLASPLLETGALSPTCKVSVPCEPTQFLFYFFGRCLPPTPTRMTPGCWLGEMVGMKL